MLGIFLSPIYIALNLYVLRWIYIWTGACHTLFQNMCVRIIIALIYLILFTSPLTAFLTKKPKFLRRALKIISNFFLGIFLYVLMVIICTDIVRLILENVFHIGFIHSHSVLVVTGTICFCIILLINLYGIFHAKHIKTTHYDILINKKVPDLDNLKIILIADAHFGYNTGTLQTHKIVKKINRQHPDLVCIAGDIFDNEYDAIKNPEKIQKIMHSLKSKYGVYACWGNHDINEKIFGGFTFKPKKDHIDELIDDRMKNFLKASNIKLLEDENILIDKKFYLLGRKDADASKKLNSPRLSPNELTKNLDLDKPILLMDHQPKELIELSKAGVDLDLSGHTHNGQIFPLNIPTKMIWKNSYGLMHIDKMINITTSGVGVWGPSMRIGSDNEICVIDVHFS